MDSEKSEIQGHEIKDNVKMKMIIKIKIKISMSMSMIGQTNLHDFFTTIVYRCFQFLDRHSEVLGRDRAKAEV